MRNTLILVALGFGLVACDALGGKSDLEKYCETSVECYPEDEVTVDECLENEPADDDPCKAEADALIGCLADLDCDGLDDYWGEPTETYPCYEFDDAYFECFVENAE